MFSTLTTEVVIVATGIVYPGTFCLPTYGHLHILSQACRIFSQVTAVCSSNPQKQPAFPPTLCSEYWHSYQLPINATVATFDQVLANLRGEEVVMVRGLRESISSHEQQVADYNHKQYDISHFHYILAQNKYRHISSTATWLAAASFNLEMLAEMASPLVTNALLETTLRAKSLWMVCGKPGSGKSTTLKKLSSTNPDICAIYADSLNSQFSAILRRHFRTNDLVKLARDRDDEVSMFLKTCWLEKLGEILQQVPANRHVLIEAAYGLMSSKELYRYFGGKVLYFDCADSVCISRNKQRGSLKLLPFVSSIPDWQQSLEIANSNKLVLARIDGNRDGIDTNARAIALFLRRNEQNGWGKSATVVDVV